MKNDTTHKVSVIMPTYNRASIILKSIDSVLSQTYQNLELIIIDDGSTDHTETLIKKIQDKRLKYIKLTKNHGACYARNLGLKKSTGDFIAFQDSDDIFLKDKIACQMENILKQNADLDFCKLQLHDSRNDEIIIPNTAQERILKTKNHHDIISLLCKGNFISTQAILAKKEIFEAATFNPKMPRLQDYDLILRIIKKCKLSYTPKVLVHLYRQDDSISKSNEKLLNACLLILNTDYDLSPAQKNTLIDNLLHCLYNEMNKTLLQSFDNYHLIEEALADSLKHNDNLRQENSHLASELQKILNSKGWRALEKARKLIAIPKRINK